MRLKLIYLLRVKKLNVLHNLNRVAAGTGLNC